jgi:hypothetical protein
MMPHRQFHSLLFLICFNLLLMCHLTHVCGEAFLEFNITAPLEAKAIKRKAKDNTKPTLMYCAPQTVFGIPLQTDDENVFYVVACQQHPVTLLSIMTNRLLL